MATTNNGVAFEIEGSGRAIGLPRRLRQRLEDESHGTRSGEEILASISHRIAAAEEKRASLLERRRAQGMAMSVAKAVLRERELEAIAKRERLEARLRRAEEQRAEYLRQRGGCRGSFHQQGHKMFENGELLAKKLATVWRGFRRRNATTYELAQRFASCGVDSQSRFEELVTRLSSRETLHNTRELLLRLARWLTVSVPEVSSINHLLKRLAPKGKKLERYPVRVFLSAFMIIGHPEVAFTKNGDLEDATADAAAKMVAEFKALVSIILRNSSGLDKPFTAHLLSFDAAWKSYLTRFIAWKVHDAKLLEEDLISTACKLEAARLQERMGQAGSDDGQVEDEHAKALKSLKSTILRVSGQSGASKMEQALEAVRSKFLEMEQQAGDEQAKLAREHIMNEFMHGASLMSLAETRKNRSSLEAKVKASFEKAFWDSIELKFVEGHDNQPVVSLVQEIRKLFEEIVPRKLKAEFQERVDDVLVSQMLDSGCVDYEYMQRLLKYCVDLMLSLGMPARDPEIRAGYASLIEDLSSSGKSEELLKKAVVKGLRFVLENLTILRADVHWARIQLDFFQKLSAREAVEYMQRAFTERHKLGAASTRQEVMERLPLTAEWLSRAKASMEAERGDYFTALRVQVPEASTRVLAFPMRTGKAGSSINRSVASAETEMKGVVWDTTDAAVRLGLLNTVCDTTMPATVDSCPETMELNVLRLRECQNDFHRAVVIATGLLALRQELVAAGKKLSATDVESAIGEAAHRMDAFLKEGNEQVSRESISKLLASVYAKRLSGSRDVEECAETMGRLLAKFLSEDHVVFNRVVTAVRHSLRNLLITGNGTQGRTMAKSSLDKVGAGVVLQDVLELAERMDTIAVVTVQVHGSWYAFLLE